MRVLVALLLVVGCVGCGDEPGRPFGGFKRNEQGRIVRADVAYRQLSDKDLADIANETDLEFLDLTGNNQITDAGMVHLKGLTKLQTLNLYGTKITDAGLVHLRGMTKLQTLNLKGSMGSMVRRSGITDAGLEHLKGLAKLQTLDLRWNHWITDAGLEHLKGLTGLQTLNLQLTMVTDAGLVHLKGLTGLQTLELSNTKVTDAGIAELQKALPNCEINH